MSDEKYGDWFCTKCIGTVLTQFHENCNYEAFWIASPLKKENAELKNRITELENALTETLNAFAHERQFGDSPFIQKQRTKFNIDEYRAIAEGEDNETRKTKSYCRRDGV